MERRHFSLHSTSTQRPATTSRALIPTQPNPPQRRIFSSPERPNRTNVEALEDTANRTHEPPAYLRDDAGMHRPFSNPRFGPLRIASREGPDIEPIEGPHGGPLQGSSDDEESEDCLPNDDSNSYQDGGSSSDQNSSESERSYSMVQAGIDSLWQINHVPQSLQDGYDDMKRDLHIRRKKLSREKRASARLSRKVEALDRELKSLQAKEKEQSDVLRAEKSNSDSLREEIEKLRSESRKDKQEFEKSQTNMSKQLDRISQDLKEGNKNLQLKNKELAQVRREVACLKQENESEVRLRETAVAESQALKRNLFDLRKRSNEEKRLLLTSQDEQQGKLTKLREQNQALTAKVGALEEAMEHQRESKELMEADLLGVLSFLRSICNTVQQVYLAACAHGGRGLEEVTAFPSLECLKIDEECREYEVFGQLFAALNESLSSESALQLASAYEEALPSFFKIIILREVVHSQYVCFTEDALKEVKAIHDKFRHHIQKERQRLRKRSMDLSSDLLLQRQQASAVKAALERKHRELEEEIMKIADKFRAFEGTCTAAMAAVTASKKYSNSVKEELTKTKKEQQELEELLSKNVRKKEKLCGEVERARAAIKNLDLDASAIAKKNKEVADALRDEIEGLTALGTQREATLEQMSIREASLRRANEELKSNSKLAIRDCEENKKRTVALNREKQKLIKEKDDFFMRATEAESAAQKMSEKVTEALAAKQSALETSIAQKNEIEDLRLKLAKSENSRAPRVQHQALQTMIDETPKDKRERGKGRSTRIGVHKTALNASLRKLEDDKLRPSSKTKHDSSLIQTEDNMEADLCEVDLVPKRPKRRASVQKPRKAPRQKRARLSTAKRATAASDTPPYDPTSTASPRAANPVQDVKPQTSSTSTPTRDADWDVDFSFGELGE